jgi:hypothetical protein
MIRNIPGQRCCESVRVADRPFLRHEKPIESLKKGLPLFVRPSKGEVVERDFQQVELADCLIKTQYQVNVSPSGISIFRPTRKVKVPNNQPALFRGHINIGKPVKEFNLPSWGTGRINVGDNPRFLRRNSRKFNRESILVLEDNTAIQLRTILDSNETPEFPIEGTKANSSKELGQNLLRSALSKDSFFVSCKQMISQLDSLITQ